MIPKTKTMQNLWIASLIGLFALAGTIHASQTDPTLFISHAVDFDGSHGRLVRIEGEFPWNALLQSGYPVQIVIWNEANDSDFVRFDLSGNAVTGNSSIVGGGLTPSEATSLSTIGVPDLTQELAYVGPGRIEARLSGSFVAVPLAAQIFVIDGGTTFVSNPISISGVAQ